MQIVRASDYSEYSKTWGIFGQDDLRLTRSSASTSGCAGNLKSALTERQNKSISGFDLGYTQPFEAGAQANFQLIPTTDVLRSHLWSE